MIKIAISGRSGTGKNTIAAILAEKLSLFPNDCCILGFADKIKQIIEVMFPDCDLRQLYGPSHLRQEPISSGLGLDFPSSITARQLSCDIGKLGRACHPKFWISHMERTVSQLPSNIKTVIIADLRFIEELEWARKQGFYLIRTLRNAAAKIDDISEVTQDGIPNSMFDEIIQNDIPLSHLEARLENLIVRFL